MEKKATDEIIKLLISTFAVIVSLAWSDAIKSSFEKSKRLKNLGPWIYAITLTVMLSIVIYIFFSISRYMG